MLSTGACMTPRYPESINPTLFESLRGVFDILLLGSNKKLEGSNVVEEEPLGNEIMVFRRTEAWTPRGEGGFGSTD